LLASAIFESWRSIGLPLTCPFKLQNSAPAFASAQVRHFRGDI
jgi:hypothetical protein